MTQIESARQGVITPQMHRSGGGRGSRAPKRSAAWSRPAKSSSRTISITISARSASAKSLRTKVNANIGASNFHQLIEEEVEKLYTAVRYGADSVMDLSTGTDLDRIRAEILSRCSVILGTVPIYQVASERSIMDLERHSSSK